MSAAYRRCCASHQHRQEGASVKVTRSGALAGLVLTSALALTSCGTDNNDSSAASSSGSPSSTSCASGSASAAGSSAQKNAMDEWIKNYQGNCSGATVNYQPVGS